jgi:uncharacterized repeat protein (TIGR01451 family)
MKSHRIASVLVVAPLLFLAVPAWSGDGSPAAKKVESSPDRTAHAERPRDPYLPTPAQPRAPRPGTRVSRSGVVSVQVNVDSFGNNVVGDAANEPSIAVDPNDPTRITIGWRQFDNVASDFRQAGWAYSSDGGNTWTFPGVIEPGHFRSDPVLSSDADGNFFYNSLTNEGGFQCKVFKSVDGGATWDSGAFAWGGDKQWQTIDQTDGIGSGNIYASWNSSFSSCSGNFTRSYDGGLSFVPCTTVAGDPYWGTLAVGPGGELYVSGAGMTVARSSTIQDPGQPAAWDFSDTVSLDGSLSFSTGPNPAGLLGQNWVAVDHSDGPTQGNVYMLASVSRTSTPDPLDVMFSRSTDGGVTWSPPVRVNDDLGTSAWQWFGTMSVAPNGRIDVVWLDTRNAVGGGYDSELYYSYSTDAGVTWSPNVALTPAFDPHVGWPQQNKMGDYFHMVSDEFGANLAYAATFNGEQDVYFARIGDPACPDDGRARLESTSYACDGTVLASVIDCGLNTDDQVAETVVVDIDSDSETGVETITLTETSPASALFEGTIALSTSDAPGVLLVTEGDTVTLTYIDADDGVGGTNVVVQDTATLDCTQPVISNVQAGGITGAEAVVTWDTDEPADSWVAYGELTPGATLFNDALTTSHGITLEGLDECTVYVFSVASMDGVGNSAIDDNGGAYYSFATGVNNQPEYPSTDTPLPINDNTTFTSSVTVPDTDTVLDVNVRLNATHTYDGDLDIFLIGPDSTRVELTTDNGDSGENFVDTIFDDEAATSITTGSAPFTGSYQPEGSLATLDGQPANGTWTLEVTDDAGVDQGTLNGWNLILTFEAQACGPSGELVSHQLEADSCSTGSTGLGNGLWDVGEHIQFSVMVRNSGTAPMSGVTVQVTSLTGGFVLLDDTASVGDLAPGQTASTRPPHLIGVITSSLQCGDTVDLQVDILSNEGSWSAGSQQPIGEVIAERSGTVLSEGFSSGIPVSWTIVDGSLDNETWYGDNASDPLLCGSPDPAAPIATGWAAVNSDCAGGGTIMDEELITPVLGLIDAPVVILEFDHWFEWNPQQRPEVGDVDVRSSLTGGIWVNVASFTGASTANPQHEILDVSALLAGTSDGEIRWRYHNAKSDYWWYLDNVLLHYLDPMQCLNETCAAPGSSPPPVPSGSLLVEPIAPDGSEIWVTWDDQCAPINANILYGSLDQVSTYAVSGAVCAIQNPEAWTAVPGGNLWFLVVTDDGAGVESSWGFGTDGERNGLADSGMCGVTAKDLLGTCP